ncbi:GIY-YIG nuclease family protein [Starkeya sp. ORNL1]|uniref:GIY-YIG nuclease family protein n=1 Tax=Starkeya sp. ORNL1 TaxID=2709380 RepID=UPI0014649080|nr:GIY-YIG nuclease family protein [Starkeya sp. ORNL1]QJP13765.1 GIY-YIG nuclease family protein [Starkeya sp. ORNL1]
MSAFVYMLRCADGSLYVGSTRTDLEKRFAEHLQGAFPDNYTFMRRPVELIWSEHFPIIADAVAAERKIKGWSRAKKEALVSGDWEAVRRLAKRSGAQVDE